MKRRIEIKGGCTPQGYITFEYFENPEGLPVVFLTMKNAEGAQLASLPLDKDAVSKIMVYTAEIIGEM